MTISTIAIISVAVFLVISITYTAIRHFRSKSDLSSYSPYFWDFLVRPGDALLEFEPIKSHYEEYEKAIDTKEALKRAILRNLIDNDYPYADPRQSIGHFRKLPDLIELQNVIKLKPIIKDIEDQYKKYEDARDKAKAKKDFTEALVQKVLNKLKEDSEMQNLALSRDVYNSKQPNRKLYDLLRSLESKEIIERCINEAINGSYDD